MLSSEMKKMNKLQERGFTLLEVLVAAAILAIVLLAMASGEATSVQTTRRSNNGSLAAASAGHPGENGRQRE